MRKWPPPRIDRAALERRTRRRRGRLLAAKRRARARPSDTGAHARDADRARGKRKARAAARSSRQRRVAASRRESWLQAGGGTALGALEPAAAATAGLGDVL